MDFVQVGYLRRIRGSLTAWPTSRAPAARKAAMLSVVPLQMRHVAGRPVDNGGTGVQSASKSNGQAGQAIGPVLISVVHTSMEPCAYHRNWKQTKQRKR